jgi:hypothetical protein
MGGTSVNYREPTMPLANPFCNYCVYSRLDQFANCPDMVGYAELHCGRYAVGFLVPAEIVMHNVKCHGGHVVLEFFAKAIGQTGEPPL